MTAPRVTGLLLAAGAGSRMGLPKALVRDAQGESWLVRSVEMLRAGGCHEVAVVLGADADLALSVLADATNKVVVAEDWAEGMGASLRTGLAALDSEHIDAVLLSLVDLPDVGADVVRRLLAQDLTPASLIRASYDGRPGHPVLLGRDHWDGVIATAVGDRGARDYLATREVELVECGDLATGRDQDTPVPPDGGADDGAGAGRVPSARGPLPTSSQRGPE